MLKKVNLFIGLIIIISGILLMKIDSISFEKQNDKELLNIYIKQSKNQKKYNYIGILNIPKIKLSKKILKISNKKNNVDKNIQTIKYINPEKNNSVIIIAGHSGTSKVSYFKDLKKLKEKDNIYIYTKDTKYRYQIIKKYEVSKTGQITIDNIKKQLILTTCSMTNKNMQLIIVSIQKEKTTL